MMAPGSARRSGPVAQAMGLRTVLAVGLLVFGAGALAAIHTVLLPRYLASRSFARESGLTRPRTLATPMVAAPPEATPVAHTGIESPPAPVPVDPSEPQPSAPVPVAHATESPPDPAPAAPPAAQPLAPEATESPLPPAGLTARPAVAVPAAKAAPAPAEAAKGAAPQAPVPEEAGDRASPPAAPIENKDSPSLLFIRNTAWLSPEARESLAVLADRLRDDPSLEVVLAGHTDDLGTPEVNRTLSLRRAVRVRAWLVERGIAPDRIEVQGLGSSQPLLSGSSREARAKNRRVEITVSERSH
jgi:outer membrane protein OmpA-like peptidoglycan-associated protein